MTTKFAGPAAQGRVRSCSDWLFYLISLINGPPRGAWATYLGSRPLTDPLAGNQAAPPTTLRPVFRVVFAAPEASKRPFCALELPTVFRTRFWRSPGSTLGAIFRFWLQHVLYLLFWSRGFSVELNFNRFCYACPLKFDCFGRCEKKAHMACDPQKPMDIQGFCMCAAPPATQQGRQQRTKHSIEKWTKKASAYVLNGLFLPLGLDVPKNLQT